MSNDASLSDLGFRRAGHADCADGQGRGACRGEEAAAASAWARTWNGVERRKSRFEYLWECALRCAVLRCGVGQNREQGNEVDETLCRFRDHTMAGWKALACAAALAMLACGVVAVIDEHEVTSLPGSRGKRVDISQSEGGE